MEVETFLYIYFPYDVNSGGRFHLRPDRGTLLKRIEGTHQYTENLVGHQTNVRTFESLSSYISLTEHFLESFYTNHGGLRRTHVH